MCWRGKINILIVTLKETHLPIRPSQWHHEQQNFHIELLISSPRTLTLTNSWQLKFLCWIVCKRQGFPEEIFNIWHLKKLRTTNLVISDLMLTTNLMSLLLLLPLLWRPKPWSICLSLYSLLLGNKDLNGGILIPEPALLILPHWWEKINKQSVVEMSVIWAKLRTLAWKTAS